MKYRKPLREDDMPADLVKRSPLAFEKWCWILINMILAGHYECQEEVLEAKVILLCKDHANPDLLSNFRPVVLCNTFYQLLNIIVTSRLRTLVEKYAVFESSQHGFRCSRSVQLVIQKARILHRHAARSDGKHFRIDLNFKNAFNSAGHSCLWKILKDLGIPDVSLSETIYNKSTMRIQVRQEPSASIQLDTGTLQGSVLSPFLFDLFINVLLRLLDS